MVAGCRQTYDSDEVIPKQVTIMLRRVQTTRGIVQIENM